MDIVDAKRGSIPIVYCVPGYDSGKATIQIQESG